MQFYTVMASWLGVTVLLLLCFLPGRGTNSSEHQWDDRGYLIFCLCMGRFGNQAEHFLGGLAFAKKIDRTLIVPPFRTYKNIEFDEWFKLEPLKEYHRVILARDFMKDLAPTHWPPGNRTGVCYGKPGRECQMKEGNPFGPFWDGLGVDFDKTISVEAYYGNPQGWMDALPVDKYPVVALRGAPAPFPMAEENIPLAKYLQWSDNIEEEAGSHIQKLMGNEKFIGIHLRNGVDWKNACEHVEGNENYMASPQCLGYGRGTKVTQKMCFPPKEEILRLVKNAVLKTKAKHIYVATDKNPMKEDLENHLKSLKVKVHHLDPWLPQIDLAILGKAELFIGNCISSFTSFVSRQRLVQDKPTQFWGYS